MPDPHKPILLATVFSDYICPFCYIGDLRLNRLRDHYDLKINWMLVEIHPETPAEGQPVGAMGYSDARWQQMMDNLQRLAEEEGVRLQQPAVSANSHQALLLAEATKATAPEIFYRLHGRLFEACFTDGLNIGAEAVLRTLAAQCGVPEDTVEAAWSDEAYARRLQANLAAAGHVGVRATPTVFFSPAHRLDGAVPYQQFIECARAGWLAQQQDDA